MKPKFNVDEREITFMSNLANDWWNVDGVWKLLHKMNEIRLDFVVQSLIKTGKLESEKLYSPNALNGLKILDAGYKKKLNQINLK